MSRKKRPILLVEDNQDDEELAILALQGAGIAGRIDVARDGEEALDYLFDFTGDPPRLAPLFVLLDIMLPKVGGFEILRRIREASHTRTIPVVMLSSSDVREDVQRAYALGANSYVCKPVKFDQYSEVVRQLGQYWIQINESPDQS